MKKVIDAMILVVVLFGCFLVWKTDRERRRLSATHDRLARATGDLTITDPAKIHMLALETGDPMHFAWRVYLPPKCSLTLSAKSGGGSTSFSVNASEFIARVRVRRSERGALAVYQHFGSGSSLFEFGDPAFASLVFDRQDKLLVEQVGADRLATFDPKQSAIFLRLSLPDDLVKAAKATAKAGSLNGLVPVFYELRLGQMPTNP